MITEQFFGFLKPKKIGFYNPKLIFTPKNHSHRLGTSYITRKSKETVLIFAQNFLNFTYKKWTLCVTDNLFDFSRCFSIHYASQFHKSKFGYIFLCLQAKIWTLIELKLKKCPANDMKFFLKIFQNFEKSFFCRLLQNDGLC